MRSQDNRLIQYLTSALFAGLALFIAPSSLLAQTDAPQRAAAEALFREATKLKARHQYNEACPRLEEVVRLLPGKVGARMALAECYESSGKLASAWATLLECEGLAKSLNDHRAKKVAESAARLLPRLTRLSIVVSQGDVPGLTIRRDDQPVGRGQWSQALPIDPGSHRVEASAPGRKPWFKLVEVAGEGKTITVEVPALEQEAPPPVEAPSVVPADPTKPPPVDRAKPARESKSLSHAWQFGAFIRTDIDWKFRGAVAVPGLTYGVGDHVEFAAAALLGRDKGFWAGASAYVLKGIVKPMFTAGTHVFFVDGPRPGVHAAAGLQVDPLRHLGFFISTGVTYFPKPPEGYEQVGFLPSVGAQGRL